MFVPSAQLYHNPSMSPVHPEKLITLLLLQMIKMGSDVEVVLRETVVQMEHIGDKTLCMIYFFFSTVFFYKIGTILESNICYAKNIHQQS